MDESRHGRGAGHGVGQPRVQRELTGLGRDPTEEQQGTDEQQGLIRAGGQGVAVDVEHVEGLTGGEEQHDHAEHEADVAHAVGPERLERGVGVGLLLPPMADQHERTHADELPTDQHLQRRGAHDVEEHRPREHAQEGVVVGEADVALEVLLRIDVHQERDDRDRHEHHRREAVDQGADLDVERHAFVVRPLEPRGGLHHGWYDLVWLLDCGLGRGRRLARAQPRTPQPPGPRRPRSRVRPRLRRGLPRPAGGWCAGSTGPQRRRRAPGTPTPRRCRCPR